MDAPRRVLHIAAGNLFGGVETFLLTLARYRESTPQLQSEFALCFDGRLASQLRKEGARVHWLGNVQLRAPWSVARANVKLAQVLADGGYHAVITHGAWPHVLVGGQLKLRPSKFVTWAHGAPLNVGFLDRAAHWLRPDLVIVNSQHTRVALGPLFRGVRSRLIYYPVGPCGSTRSRADVRRELGTSEDTQVIAFAGRFERWKGLDLLLKAAAALATRQPDGWCIWVCGGLQRESERQYHRELTEYVRSHSLESRVKFLGHRSDVPELLRAADMFCQPNTAPEPFGIVFIEALYAGLPIISTEMGGAAEIVNSDCGILTEPTPEAVADGLQRLLTNAELRAALKQFAPGRAFQLCNPTQRIDDLATAIAELEAQPHVGARWGASPLD